MEVVLFVGDYAYIHMYETNRTNTPPLSLTDCSDLAPFHIRKGRGAQWLKDTDASKIVPWRHKVGPS